MIMLGRLICALPGHLYRRARKHEDATRKYCARCMHAMPVRKRKGNGAA